MPQLDTSVYITQIFWLLITFISFWFIMDKLLVPKIAEKIEERKRKYNDYILKAEEINKKALNTLNIYEKELAVARNDALKQINANETELENFVREKEDEINERLKKQMAENEKKLAVEMDKALAKVDDASINIAWAIAERLDLSSVKKEDIETMASQIGLE